jgi:hypothetical protein
MSGPLQVVEEKLRKHPGLGVERGEGYIAVLPQAADGFRVEIREGGGRVTVYLEGWHEEFERTDEALECFAMGLSEQTRLCVVSRGGFDCSWTLEIWHEGDWVTESTTGLLLFPFWMRSVKRHLQNHLVRTTPP